jgi:hypothetical protein
VLGVPIVTAPEPVMVVKFIPFPAETEVTVPLPPPPEPTEVPKIPSSEIVKNLGLLSLCVSPIKAFNIRAPILFSIVKLVEPKNGASIVKLSYFRSV